MLRTKEIQDQIHREAEARNLADRINNKNTIQQQIIDRKQLEVEAQEEAEAVSSTGGAEEVPTAVAEEPAEQQGEEEEMDIVEEEEETQDMTQMPDETTVAEITQSLTETEVAVSGMLVEEPLQHEETAGEAATT